METKATNVTVGSDWAQRARAEIERDYQAAKKRDAIKAAERAVIDATDQWEADDGNCVDYEIDMAKKVCDLRKARAM